MFKQHTSPKRKADKQLEVGLFPLFLHCNCVITWTAVILLDLHATERRVGPAREGSELKMEERGVCRLSTIRALSNSGLLGLLGALLCRTGACPANPAWLQRVPALGWSTGRTSGGAELRVW